MPTEATSIGAREVIEQGMNGAGLVASMATPAVLLLANAMLILSTHQRLQSILERIRELRGQNAERVRGRASGEGAAAGEADAEAVHLLAHRHLRREVLAHRALLSFYLSSGLFILLVLAVGLGGLGAVEGEGIPVAFGLGGTLLLLGGIGHLAAETWLGLSATHEQAQGFPLSPG